MATDPYIPLVCLFHVFQFLQWVSCVLVMSTAEGFTYHCLDVAFRSVNRPIFEVSFISVWSTRNVSGTDISMWGKRQLGVLGMYQEFMYLCGPNVCLTSEL